MMKAKKPVTIRSWEIVFPNDANPQKTMFGGKLMSIMDKTAAIAASQFARRMVVTASTEAMDFINPVYVGDRIQTTASVVWVGKTSMVVRVDVVAENPLTEGRRHCVSAHFNFVALDKNNNPAPVPPLLVETEDEKREYRIAEIVKKNAIERKKKIAETSRIGED
ncbi:MAG: acyl-CoA thioesterase [Calditrichia bacterium]